MVMSGVYARPSVTGKVPHRQGAHLAAHTALCYVCRMAIAEMNPVQAHEVLKSNPGARYLDVRTEPEFEAGHPAGALNVPVIIVDPATRQPRLNPDFVATVEGHFSRTTKLLIGCQSGGRSERACVILAEAGYTDVTNVQGGFGGAHDATGRTQVPGWRDAGLPVETGQSKPR
jgi:rhodanese-related sulfurtransferase